METFARIIAFYLPQYYPTAINDLFYGKGFTEWTNVGKARPLFKGHYQPKVPADLGYYDLRYSEVRELQAELARDAGVEGFCYYHYWFGEGHQELEIPFQEVVRLKKPDYPFCLCWANQSWYSKFWNNDSACPPIVVAEQKYDNNEWRTKHFYSLLDAFKDDRYIRVNGKLLFMIYRPLEYSDITLFMKDWRELAAKNNLGDFYFVGQARNDCDAEKILKLGFDGVNIVRYEDFLKYPRYSNSLVIFLHKIQRFMGQAPYHYDYGKVYRTFIKNGGLEINRNVFPTILPNWDHSPRSGKRALILDHSTPENFEKHLIEVCNVIKDKPKEEKIIFLKSWNEWGEGNYMEPDLKYGHGYLNALRRVIMS